MILENSNLQTVQAKSELNTVKGLNPGVISKVG